MPVVNGPLPIEHVWRYRILFVGGILMLALGTVTLSWKILLIGVSMLGVYSVVDDEDIRRWRK